MKVVMKFKESWEVYGGRPKPPKSPQDVEVGKWGWLGNPFPMEGGESGREACIAKFKVYFDKRIKSDPIYRKAVRALRGKKVACFCHPKHCHLDVVAGWVNSQK